MTFRTFTAAAVSAFALAIAAPSIASAQDAAPAPEVPMEAQPTTPDYGEDTLRSFAVAFLEVAKVSQEYQPQLQGAASAEDEQRVRTEAGEKMLEAVQAVDGITVDEYTAIMQAAQTDPELAQEINNHISAAAQ
jgi:hypothetical protein